MAVSKHIRSCSVCGTIYSRVNVRQGRGHYCSRICGGKARREPLIVDRFLSYVQPEPNSGCWIWIGSRDPRQYGQLRLGQDRLVRAHRLSWTLFRGQIPLDLWVLHHCDNPPCVNPGHLFLGTHHDNMVDAVAKCRTTRGERNPQAKLTRGAVIAIRQAKPGTIQDLARAFGVTRGTAYHIRCVDTWAHIQS